MKLKNIDVTDALKKAADDYAKQQAKWNGTREFKPALKFYKKLGVFKASNVSFDPATIQAHSYRWWKFVAVIGNKVVFNSYKYSPSTSRHQNKVRNLLSQLGVTVDVTIQAPKGLDNLESAINGYQYAIAAIETAIANPKSRKGKNAERVQTIASLAEKIKVVQGLIRCESIDNRKAA